ncbi:uncharacterized protein LOC143230945 [Tachypleus tridentatus]|uniref:uncharacterized protein LOC143230945 n=1 Tax=Tachypleus tridentatus TaxID=6853 RepID=UPI003FD3B67A
MYERNTSVEQRQNSWFTHNSGNLQNPSHQERSMPRMRAVLISLTLIGCKIPQETEKNPRSLWRLICLTFLHLYLIVAFGLWIHIVFTMSLTASLYVLIEFACVLAATIIADNMYLRQRQIGLLVTDVELRNFSFDTCNRSRVRFWSIFYTVVGWIFLLAQGILALAPLCFDRTSSILYKVQEISQVIMHDVLAKGTILSSSLLYIMICLSLKEKICDFNRFTRGLEKNHFSLSLLCKLRKHYSLFRSQMSRLDNLFGPVIMMFYMYTIISIICLVTSLICVGITIKYGVFYLMYLSTVLVSNIIILSCLTLAASFLTENAQDLTTFLTDFTNNDLETKFPIHHHLQFFLLEIQGAGQELTICKMVSITRGLFVGLGGAVLTYIVITLQINPETKQKLNI